VKRIAKRFAGIAGRQCRPRPDAAEARSRGHSGISQVHHGLTVTRRAERSDQFSAARQSFGSARALPRTRPNATSRENAPGRGRASAFALTSRAFGPVYRHAAHPPSVPLPLLRLHDRPSVVLSPAGGSPKGVGSALLLGIALGASASSIAADQPAPDKKLIEYGWDVPTPQQMREELTAMEKRPFDGVIFRLGADTTRS